MKVKKIWSFLNKKGNLSDDLRCSSGDIYFTKNVSILCEWQRRSTRPSLRGYLTQGDVPLQVFQSDWMHLGSTSLCEHASFTLGNSPPSLEDSFRLCCVPIRSLSYWKNQLYLQKAIHKWSTHCNSMITSMFWFKYFGVFVLWEINNCFHTQSSHTGDILGHVLWSS